MGGVVKGFQIACNLAGLLGDLTGKVLGRCSLGTVLDQSSLGTKQSWGTGLGTLVLGQ